MDNAVDRDLRLGSAPVRRGQGCNAPPLERVVVVSDDAVASGGAAMMALASARLVRGAGIPVTVLSGLAERDPALANMGIDVIDLGGSHVLKGSRLAAAWRGLNDGALAARLAVWIERNDTPGTIYHLHNWHKVLSPAALGALRPVGSRLVLSAHDFFLACPNGGFFDYRRDTPCELRPLSGACIASNCDKRRYAHKLWRLARHVLRQRAIDLARAGATVIAVHEGMVELLGRGGIPASAIEVLRNPVSPWLDERITAESNHSVLYVGRLEHDKGIDVLAEAARRAGARVRAVGEGPLRDSLARDYPGIELCGRLDQAAIGRLAREARLLVVPTRVRETFGLVALEGLMSGLPVVTTTTALISGEVARLGLGVACAPGDAAALTEALRRLAADDAAVAVMSWAAFKGARALAPRPQEWCDALLDLYRRKLARLAS
jgi:glycosyltransferase involved in cell wall biosynthesis